jgi:hypothetical protein
VRVRVQKVAEHQVELDYVFDRLGDFNLAQAYRLLVPENQRMRERSRSNESRSDLREGVIRKAEG